MAQQILDGGLALGGLGFDGRLALRVGLDHADLHVRHGRQILGDRVGQEQPALLDQHHDGDRRHRLAHGGEREDGIARHLDLAGRIQEADGLEVGELPLARDGDDRAGDAALLDVGFQHRGDALQALAGEADFLGRALRKGVGKDGRAGENGGKCGGLNAREHGASQGWAVGRLD